MHDFVQPLQSKFFDNSSELPSLQGLPWYHPAPSELEEIAATSAWAINKLEILDTGLFWAVLNQ